MALSDSEVPPPVKLSLLVNPAAGRGRMGKRLPAVVRALERLGASVEWRCSSGQGHLTAMAREWAAGRAAGLVPVVCGGDGSVNEVINGLHPFTGPLGIIPGGRGDDISRCLGIPSSVEGACAALLSGEPRPVDLVRAGSRLFAGIGGAGVDSEVTRLANESTLPLPGAAAYSWAVLRALASFSPSLFSIEADGWSYEGSVMFAGVANAPSYGGGMRLSPGSLMDDGKVEVCIVEEMGRLELLGNLPRLYLGSHLSHRRVKLFSAERLRIASDRPADFYGDGEFLSPLPVELAVLPSAVRIITPPWRERCAPTVRVAPAPG